MEAEDYFSMVTGLGVREAERSTIFPYPPQTCRKTSTTSITSSCRSFSSNSYDRFTNSQVSDLKASTLCASQGTVPGFRLLGEECCYLGYDQPTGDEMQCALLRQRIESQRRQSSCKAKRQTRAEPISFVKREVRKSDTSSLLTRSMRGSMYTEGLFEGLRCEDLPSAFDDDEEDE